VGGVVAYAQMMTTELPALRTSTAGRHASDGRWPYFVVPLFWVLMALLFAGQLWFMEDLSWNDAMMRAMADWLPWVFLSPAIFWVAIRFPIRPGRIVRSLLVSAAVCVVSVWAAEEIFQSILRQIGFAPGLASTEAGRPALGEREGPPAGGAKKKKKFARPGETGPAGRHGPMQHIMHFHLPMGLFVIMASNAYAYFLGMRERERKASDLARSLAEARLSALQMQVHPHFLFNSLNAIAVLVHKDPHAAEETITNLSELLRVALSTRHQHEVTLAQELSYLECYLAIERIRFGDRLQVEWAIADDARAGHVPVLLLQPLVENAIRHGIERRTEDIGRVKITAAVRDRRLVMTVRDNGPGPQKTVAGDRRGHGVGLDNTRARLATLHGVEAEVRLEAADGGGCLVTVTCPFFTQPRNLA
jgi:signal transduction histidine kinase